MWWCSGKVGGNITVWIVCLTAVTMAAVIVGVRAAENVDRLAPDTDDKVGEMVDDGGDSEANICVTLSTFSTSWCEAFISES